MTDINQRKEDLLTRIRERNDAIMQQELDDYADLAKVQTLIIFEQAASLLTPDSVKDLIREVIIGEDHRVSRGAESSESSSTGRPLAEPTGEPEQPGSPDTEDDSSGDRNG